MNEKQRLTYKIRPMEKQFEEIREQQKASWNKSSPGWKKWDDLTMDFLKPFGDKIIQHLHLKDTDVVLDVAAGTGEPGLTIASIVKSGKVIMTDLADDMLVIARENAQKAGIKNIEFSVSDVCELPFPDNTFDAISCRMGFMFFPDMLLAAKEMVRVLKPGGRIAVSVWTGPDKNFWFSGIMGIIKQNMELPTPPLGSPGMFRCAKDGLISDLFIQAGLKDISQIEIPTKLKCQTAETYWSFVSEVVGPVVSALSTADSAMKEKIKSETFQLVNQKYAEGKVLIDASAFVISARK
ncbi:class I SAM-dependent methyltransferase [Daejeonella sp. H1SJ63]|jgi:ubiquinone/menaquinone biosynthesis C-methylase UbiE|uniref:class I SAM-dependent methyltransferase n=1 Tax=Daejeonella sp. H1SJ63 TaxID=3034145 RepID=UPI0023EB6A67|nr:class I SAM-dependent methyltransferase [Daejeonella sp. H1SJ63]